MIGEAGESELRDRAEGAARGRCATAVGVEIEAGGGERAGRGEVAVAARRVRTEEAFVRDDHAVVDRDAGAERGGVLDERHEVEVRLGAGSVEPEPAARAEGEVARDGRLNEVERPEG